jgi:hypothetical protein
LVFLILPWTISCKSKALSIDPERDASLPRVVLVRHGLPIRLEAKPELLAAKLRRVPPSDKGLARLAIAIMAYKDLEHLIRLIRGVYMPHQCIIIHLERPPDPEFERGVREYAMAFNNVVVLKFYRQNGGINRYQPSNHALDRF